mmetsp:Transcript_5451/g.11981  ORF Transcript_5451/g.11981 Transcript_5451/m.11981 type:complete len:83 (-) Transcript_5451:79-327(-)
MLFHPSARRKLCYVAVTSYSSDVGRAMNSFGVHFQAHLVGSVGLRYAGRAGGQRWCFRVLPLQEEVSPTTGQVVFAPIPQAT